MTTKRPDDRDWPYIRTLLPAGLDESARDCSALRRRRGLLNADALVRLLLTYGATDLSLKSVAAWGKAMELAELSVPALFYRVRDAERWLSHLLAEVLQDEVTPARTHLRLRIVDATVINGPGAKGTEWRAHVLADARTGRFCAVDLTDEHGGEGYARHPVDGRDVVLGDRGYAHARGIAAAVAQGAAVVVRINPQTIRLCDLHRRPVKLTRPENAPAEAEVKTLELLMPVPPEKRSKTHKSWPLDKASAWLSVTVHAARTRRGKVIWVLSTLPADIAPAEVMDLYRLRWQIELLFKRLKTLLFLDALPSRQGPTARSWILARFLAAALAQRLTTAKAALSPWGYALR